MSQLPFASVKEKLAGYKQPWIEWTSLDGVDCPPWVTEDLASTICSFLNTYIPTEYSTRGTRYHMLNRYPEGGLYFHLIGRPVA